MEHSAVADAASANGLCRVLTRWQAWGLSGDGAQRVALKAIESLAAQHRVQAGWFMPSRLSADRVGGGAPRERSIPTETSPSEPLIQPMPHQPEGCKERQHGKAQINARLDPLEGPETICRLIAHKEGLRTVGLKALNGGLGVPAAY